MKFACYTTRRECISIQKNGSRHVIAVPWIGKAAKKFQTKKRAFWKIRAQTRIAIIFELGENDYPVRIVPATETAPIESENEMIEMIEKSDNPSTIRVIFQKGISPRQVVGIVHEITFN